MQSKGLKVASAFKPFTMITSNGEINFNYGSLLIPVSKQKKTSQNFAKNRNYTIQAFRRESRKFIATFLQEKP